MAQTRKTDDNSTIVHDLQSAIQEARIEQAERDDAYVELRETERARLIALEEALDGVFNDIPESHKDLALALLPGDPPRYWVDSTAFVIMSRDKHTYRFVKDSRLGRTLLHESTNVERIADAVTRYVADRIVERQRAVEESWIIEHNRGIRKMRADGADIGPPRSSMLLGFSMFGLGMIAGVALLLTYAWFIVE